MHLFVLFFISFFSIHLYAVDPIVEVSVNPQSIGTNETAEIRVNIINDRAQEPPLLSANSSDFDIVYRGFMSQHKIDLVNGVATSSTINTYSYRFTPKKSGTFTIPSFIIMTRQGSKFYSKSSTITVQNIARTRPQNTGGFGFANTPFSSFFGNQIDSFVQLRANQTEIPQNTGILVDLYLYSNDPNFLAQSSKLQIARNQQFNGGTIYNIPIQDHNDIITEQFGFDTYYGKLVQKYLIFPLDTGKLTLYPPVLFSHRLQQNIVGDGLDLFSNPTTDSLSYIGDELSISHSLSASNVKVSDELILTLVIEGNGNIDFFTDPFKSLTLSNIFIATPESDLEVEYDEAEQDSYVKMRKTFTYTLIAKEEGNVILPELNFNFFTSKAQATNITYPPITFNIQKSTTQTARSESFETVNTSEKKIYYYSGTLITIISLLLGILMIVISFLYAKEQQRLSDNPLYARATRAKTRLKKLLFESEQAIKKKLYKDAARLIRQSMLYFCADKFGISNSSSPQEIMTYLKNNNIDFSASQGFIQLMNELDFYAFGSTPTEIQITNYLNEAYLNLEEFDKIKIKKDS